MADTPDVDTLRRTMQQLGVARLKEEWLEEFAYQLEGILEVVRPLDQLDLPQEEPARIFINPKG